MHWWLSDIWEMSPSFTVCWVMWVIVSITLHELGHGWMAIRCGDQTPIALGRMTFNPFVHIPFPWAWIMFAVFGFTWGLMPVNPASFRGRYDDAKVAFAGPLVNFTLATACTALDIAWLLAGPTGNDPLHQHVHTFLFTGVMINAVGFMFNLLPVPPLDGSRILGDFYPAFSELWRGQKGQIIGIIAFIVLFRYGSEVVWGTAIRTSHTVVGVPVRVLGGDYRPPF